MTLKLQVIFFDVFSITYEELKAKGFPKFYYFWKIKLFKYPN